MSNNQTGVSTDPNVISGFGSHSTKEVEELQKALSISQNYGTTAPGSLSGGSALAVEDLDRTLKLVTNSLKHLVLWKDIKKEKVSQTVYEYNVQNSYGAEVPAFFAMGSNPASTDAAYDRETAQVKYLGTQGQVQHNLTLIQAAHGPVISREVKNKTIELLSKNERYMFDADSNINSLEYDGLYGQITTKEQLSQYKSTAFAGYEAAGADDSVVIDVSGTFTDAIAEKAALKAINNFGMPTDMYLGTDIHSDFSRDFYEKQRTAAGASLTSGNKVPQHSGSLDYNFKPSLFVRPRKAPLSVAVSASSAPTTANEASPADAASNFETADAGTYSYRISAVYSDGETLASTAASIAVSAGDKVTSEITFSGTPLYFNVYRAPVGTTTGHEFIGRIAKGTSGAAHNIDFNENDEGTAKAYLLQHDADVLVWKQLGSMIKYDLAITDTSYKWNQLMYGNVVVMAPRKNVILKNITRAS